MCVNALPYGATRMGDVRCVYVARWIPLELVHGAQMHVVDMARELSELDDWLPAGTFAQGVSLCGVLQFLL